MRAESQVLACPIIANWPPTILLCCSRDRLLC